VRWAKFRYQHRRRKLDRHRPFRARFRVGAGRFGYRVRATVKLRDRRVRRFSRAVRPCTRVAPR
jgi:hypothetical protein